MLTKLLVIILFGVFAWWMYTPLPDDMANQTIVRIANVTIKAAIAVSKIGEWFGFGDHIRIFRKIHRSFYHSLDTPRNIKIINTKFEDIPVRFYKYSSPDFEDDSAILYFHGGGWVIGDLDMNDSFLKMLCEKSKKNIVSVGYRLAPEYPYPIPLEDCLKATLHFFRSASSFGVNPERIALMGDSAGGNMVSAVNLKLIASNHIPMPRIQILIYPVTQVIDLALPSHVEKSGVGILSSAYKSYFILCYLNKSQEYASVLSNNQHLSKAERALYQEDLNVWALSDKYRSTAIGSIKKKGNVDELPPDIQRNADLDEIAYLVQNPFISPLLAEDLSSMPRTYILTTGQDPLLSEALLFAEKLERSGVEVEWVNYQSSLHGIFSNMLDSNVEIAIDHLAKYITDNL